MDRTARTLAVLAAATCLSQACAADPGDPLKATAGLAGGSSSSSGGPGSSSSSSSGGDNSSSSGSTSSSSSSSGFGSSTGGSSSGGGTSSSGVGPVDAGIADTGPDAPSGPSCVTMNPKSASVQYSKADTAMLTATTTITFTIAVSNAGFATLNLSDVTVRYWFSADSNALSGIVWETDYAANGTGITADVKTVLMPAPLANVTPTSDSYLEFSFTAAAGSVTGLGGSPATIQGRMHGTNYSDMFNETNDYSFDPTAKAAFQPTTTITAYAKGVLVWGCEPGSGTPAGSSVAVDAGDADAAAPAVATDGGTAPVVDATTSE
jgi:Cellulose binding domain